MILETTPRIFETYLIYCEKQNIQQNFLKDILIDLSEKLDLKGSYNNIIDLSFFFIFSEQIQKFNQVFFQGKHKNLTKFFFQGKHKIIFFKANIKLKYFSKSKNLTKIFSEQIQKFNQVFFQGKHKIIFFKANIKLFFSRQT